MGEHNAKSYVDSDCINDNYDGDDDDNDVGGGVSDSSKHQRREENQVQFSKILPLEKH